MTTPAVILMRHAHAEWPHYEGLDFDRPLTPRGVEEARLSAQAMHAALPPPVLILASPARRTRHTAEIVAAEFGLPEGALCCVDALYNATPATLAEQLHASGWHGGVLLVGHNPGISQLAQQLAGNPELPFFVPAQWRELPLA